MSRASRRAYSGYSSSGSGSSKTTTFRVSTPGSSFNKSGGGGTEETTIPKEYAGTEQVTTPEGGTKTLTGSGQYTERDKQGNIIKQYKIKEEQEFNKKAEEIYKQKVQNIKQQKQKELEQEYFRSLYSPESAKRISEGNQQLTFLQFKQQKATKDFIENKIYGDYNKLALQRYKEQQSQREKELEQEYFRSLYSPESAERKARGEPQPTFLQFKQKRASDNLIKNKIYGDYNKLALQRYKEQQEKYDNSTLGKAYNLYSKYEKKTRENVTYPIADFLKEKTGMTKEEAVNRFYDSKLVKFNPFYAPNFTPEKYKKLSEDFHKGVPIGILEDLKEKPFKNLLIAGVSFGFGVTVSPSLKLISQGTGIGSKVAKGVTYLVGAVFVGTEVYRISKGQTSYEKGKITGSALVDLGSAYAGSKLAEYSPVKLEYVGMKVPVQTKTVSKLVNGKYVPVSSKKLSKLPFKSPDPETKVLYRGISVSVYEKGYPLIGVSQKKIVIGTPTIKGDYPIAFGYQPISGAETRIFAKNIDRFITKESTMLVQGSKVSPELQKELFLKALEFQYAFKNQPSAFTQTRVLLEGTKGLKPEAVKKILDLAKESGGIPFGSKPTSPQLKPELRRRIGDIDIWFADADEGKISQVTMKGLEAIRSTGQSARLSPGYDYIVEVRKGGDWIKAVEFKSPSVESPDLQVPAKVLGFDLNIEKETTRIEGYKVASITGESKRKLAGITMFNEPGALGVRHTGRYKDLPDFFRIAETQLDSGKLKGISSQAISKGEELLSLAPKLGVSYRNGEVILPLTSQGETVEQTFRLLSPRLPPTEVRPPRPRPVSPSSQPLESPRLSYVPSPSPSPSPSFSPLSYSPSPSVSPSRSPSPYLSPSPSVSVSPSPSSSPSPSVSPSPSISPSPSPSPSPSVSPSPSPSLSPSPSKSLYPYTSVRVSPDQGDKQGFVVLVRKRGIFRKVSVQPNLKKAVAVGKANVFSTASASFKVVPISGNESLSSRVKGFLSNKFYESKREPGVFIQKRQFRISSPGEKKEITFKGLLSLKSKRRSKGVFGFLGGK